MKTKIVKNCHLIRLLLFITTFAFLFCLSGCGIVSAVDEGLKENKRKSDDKYWAERNVPPVDLELTVSFPAEEYKFDIDARVSRCVYKFLEEDDKENLKKMFANSVLAEYDALDDDLTALIAYYKELNPGGYELKTRSEYKVHKIDPLVNIIEYTIRTKFLYEGEEYVLEILFVTESIPDENLLGVHGIRLRNRETNEQIIVNTINTDIMKSGRE